jgi:uncharacterized protein YjbI with pentapeptide repeats
VDGDIVNIAYAVVFDVNMSGYSSGVTININSGGSLTASTTAGSYYLKCNGNITVNSGGAFLVGTAGTPYPPSCQFTVNINGGWAFTGPGNVAIYCSEPVVKTLQLNTATAANATVLDVRVYPSGAAWDPTADAGNWTAGQTVRCDYYGPSTNSTARIISSTSANTLTLTAGSMTSLTVGSLIHLINRNVWITGATNSALNGVTAVTLAAQLSGNSTGINNCTGVTVSGGTISGNTFGINDCISVTISGGTFSGNYYGFNICTGVTVSGITFSGNNYGISNCTGATISGSTFIGHYNVIYGCPGVTVSGSTFSGNSNVINNCKNVTISGSTFNGNSYGINSCMGATVSGITFSGNSNVISNCTGVTISGSTFSGNTYELLNCSVVIANTTFSGTGITLNDCACIHARNVLFSSSTDNSTYNTIDNPPWAYADSRDHNQVAGAYKAWTRGGIVTSQGSAVPLGYTSAYAIACANAANWGFYQEDYTIAPGQRLVWLVYRQQTTSTSALAEVVQPGNDPLVSSTQAALVQVTFGADINAWAVQQIEYTNATGFPQTVTLRVRGRAASGTLYVLPVLAQGQQGW